jgi:predicted pyridoxine 5'-phosphate oxidase superfamily flavin-nucleotide-binding protein
MTDTLLATATRAIAKRSFGVLATTSDASRPHVAGVLYSAVGHTLYVSTLRDSRKARNIAANPRVAVTVPVRRLPVGPPSGVQFQGTARILDNDDPEVRDLAAAGRLKAISGHGELELDGGCVLRITPGRRLVTFGLGMPLLSFLRDPLNAAGAVDLPVGTAV